jgi:hypothetical protein
MTKVNIKTDVLIESGKELGRVALIAILPILIAQLESGKIDWKIVGIAGAIAILKAIDKGIHVYGKAKKNTSLEKGLVRF